MKKYSNEERIPTPKKYEKELKLIDKFEAMTSEERQLYLNDLEQQISELVKKIEAMQLDSNEANEAYFDFLEKTTEMSILGALLGMSYAPNNHLLYGAGAGICTGAITSISQIANNNIKKYTSKKKLDSYMKEWVACSIAENLSNNSSAYDFSNESSMEM